MNEFLLNRGQMKIIKKIKWENGEDFSIFFYCLITRHIEVLYCLVTMHIDVYIQRMLDFNNDISEHQFRGCVSLNIDNSSC